MHSRFFLSSVLAAVPATVRAQSVTADSTVTWSAAWAEAPGGNNNGILEPGESAILSLSVAFTNQFMLAHFSPPLGPFGSGTIRGFGYAALDLHGTGGAQGMWNTAPNAGYGNDPMWDLGGREGMRANSGADLLDIEPGQYVEHIVITTNPILAIWRGLWTPSSYASRDVTFQVAGDPIAGQFVSSVYLQVSRTLSAAVFVDPGHLVLGSLTIAVVPAPSALLIFAAPVMRRRRR